MKKIKFEFARSALLTLSLVIVIVISAVGMTNAWFFDSEIVTSNTIKLQDEISITYTGLAVDEMKKKLMLSTAAENVVPNTIVDCEQVTIKSTSGNNTDFYFRIKISYLISTTGSVDPNDSSSFTIIPESQLNNYFIQTLIPATNFVKQGDYYYLCNGVVSSTTLIKVDETTTYNLFKNLTGSNKPGVQMSLTPLPAGSSIQILVSFSAVQATQTAAEATTNGGWGL